jgi:hypothetical protein
MLLGSNVDFVDGTDGKEKKLRFHVTFTKCYKNMSLCEEDIMIKYIKMHWHVVGHYDIISCFINRDRRLNILGLNYLEKENSGDIV